MSTRGHIDSFNMMVVGRYFEGTDDFCNLEMVNTKYRDMTGRYKYNPIPINDERSRMMFSGMETQHVYSEDDRMLRDGNITRHVYWYRVSYGEYKKKRGNDEYKCVMYSEEDRTEHGDRIPPTVQVIGEGSFRGNSSLSSINIPSTVSSLDDNCFLGCHSLTSITIPSSVSVIGNRCFQ